MGGSNTTINLTSNVQRYKGEREATVAKIAKIEAAIESLPSLKARVAHLDTLIAAAELIVREIDPEWSAAGITPRRKTNNHSPVPYGLLGRTGLEVMQAAPPEGMWARDVAREIMVRFSLDPTDRKLLDRVANSMNAYLKKHDGDLVESDGERLYRRWRLIRRK